jgi:hypothetical protein
MYILFIHHSIKKQIIVVIQTFDPSILYQFKKVMRIHVLNRNSISLPCIINVEKVTI